MASREYWLNSAGTFWKRPGFSSITGVSSFVAFTAGTVEPVGRLDGGTRNVGHRIPDAELEVVAGDVTLTAGMVVEGKDILGRVTGGGAGAIVRDCIVRGQDNLSNNSQSWLSRGGGSGTFQGAAFEWCTLDQTGREGGWTNGFEGGYYTADYCDILRTVDGAEFNANGNASIRCSRISHGVYFSWWNTGTGAVRTATFTDFGGKTWTAPFPSQSSGDTHSDGIQVMKGQNNVIRGNSIGAPRPYTSAQTTHLDPTISADYAIMAAMNADAGFSTSAIMVNGDTSSPLGLLIELNWLAGGTATLNLGPNGSDTLSGVTVQNNRFKRPLPGVGTFAILNGAGSAATITGNVWDDTGTAVTITNG